MSWIFEERHGSGDFTVNPPTYTLRYVAGRHGDENYVKTYAVAATPMIFKGLFRQDIQAKSLGGGMFHVDVTYGQIQQPQQGSYRISYDTTGATAHVTQAKEHLNDYPSASAPNHGGALNVEDHRAEGVDIVIPAFRWTEEHTLPISIAGWTYSQTLAALTGMVNNATFRNFAAGEVLFTGAQASYSSDAENAMEVQIAYNFEHQPSLSNVTFGTVTGVYKTGHQYLWFEHEVQEDTTAYRAKSPLIAVHRERLYDSANFGLLQIGS